MWSWLGICLGESSFGLCALAADGSSWLCDEPASPRSRQAGNIARTAPRGTEELRWGGDTRGPDSDSGRATGHSRSGRICGERRGSPFCLRVCHSGWVGGKGVLGGVGMRRDGDLRRVSGIFGGGSGWLFAVGGGDPDGIVSREDSRSVGNQRRMRISLLDRPSTHSGTLTRTTSKELGAP